MWTINICKISAGKSYVQCLYSCTNSTCQPPRRVQQLQSRVALMNEQLPLGFLLYRVSVKQHCICIKEKKGHGPSWTPSKCVVSWELQALCVSISSFISSGGLRSLPRLQIAQELSRDLLKDVNSGLRFRICFSSGLGSFRRQQTDTFVPLIDFRSLTSKGYRCCYHWKTFWCGQTIISSVVERCQTWFIWTDMGKQLAPFCNGITNVCPFWDGKC